MGFEQEMLNSNNIKYLVTTIGYKLKYVIYDSTTTAIANRIALGNIGPRVKPQFHYWFSGLTKRKLPMQCTKST